MTCDHNRTLSPGICSLGVGAGGSFCRLWGEGGPRVSPFFLPCLCEPGSASVSAWSPFLCVPAHCSLSLGPRRS